MRLGFILRVTVFLIIGLTLGVGSARWLIARSASAVPLGTGAWKIWSPERDNGDDPYGIAHYFLSGRLPPAANQVRIYETEEDDDGALFDGDCIYTVSGPSQAARWWEIAVIDPQAGPRFESDERMSGISSAQIVNNPDGNFNITIARDPMPGNWISPGDLSHYSVAVSLRFARLRDTLDPAAVLPRITRGECS